MKVKAEHKTQRVVAIIGLEPRLNVGRFAGPEAVTAVEDSPVEVQPDGLAQVVLADVGNEGFKFGAL